jgi:hypothetical protein
MYPSPIEPGDRAHKAKATQQSSSDPQGTAPCTERSRLQRSHRGAYPLLTYTQPSGSWSLAVPTAAPPSPLANETGGHAVRPSPITRAGDPRRRVRATFVLAGRAPDVP